jgi:hypothetical protein
MAASYLTAAGVGEVVRTATITDDRAVSLRCERPAFEISARQERAACGSMAAVEAIKALLSLPFMSDVEVASIVQGEI